MAHYVAQCIADARAARGKAGAKARERCQNAILALWAHRAELPDGRRPLAAIEPLITLVQALDPEQPRGFFLRRVWDSIDAEPPTRDSALLGEIRTLDRGARLLIGTLLRTVAARAADEAQPWIELATAAQLGNRPDIDLIIHLTENDGPTRAEAERHARLVPLREKHTTLVVLSEQANALAEAYAREIAMIEGEA